MQKQTLENNQGLALVAINILAGMGIYFISGTNLGHNAWQAVLPALIFGWLMIIFIIRIFKAAPGKCFFELTKFCEFSNSTIWYAFWFCIFFLICALFMAAGLKMWIILTQSKMPVIIYILTICLLLGYGAYLGINTISRFSILVLFVFIAVIVIDTLFLLGDMKWYRILPVDKFSIDEIIPPIAQISFSMILLLPMALFYLPGLKNKNSTSSIIIKGFLLVSAYYVLVCLRNIFLFGNLLMVDDYPIVRSLRMINAGRGINCLEYLGILVLLSVIFSSGILIWIVLRDIINVFEHSQENRRKKIFKLLLLGFSQALLIWLFYYRISFLKEAFYTTLCLIIFSAEILMLVFMLKKFKSKNIYKNP